MGRGAMPRGRPGTTFALLWVVLAHANQQTAVLPALPLLQQDLGATATWTNWVASAFLLVTAVATPLVGKLGDRRGKRRMLVVAISAFTLGSLLAAVAESIAVVIAARAVQGIAGGVIPLAVGVVRDDYPEERVGVVIGMIFAATAAGTSLGVVASGILIDYVSWRVMFVFTAACGVVGLALVMRYVPDSPPRPYAPLDLPGAALLSVGVGGLLLAITLGADLGWTSAPVVGLLCASSIAFGVWVLVELRVRYPLLDVRVLARRTMLMTQCANTLYGFAIYVPLVTIPAFVMAPQGLSADLAAQVDYGFAASATMAGLYLAPGFLAGLLTGPLTGVLIRRTDPSLTLAGGLALVGLGTSFVAIWHTEPWQVVAGMFLVGVAHPIVAPSLTTTVISSVRADETSVATGVTQVVRAIGSAVGTQVVAAILAIQVIAGTTVPTEGAFITVLWVSAGVSAASVIMALCAVSAVRPRPATPVAVALEEAA